MSLIGALGLAIGCQAGNARPVGGPEPAVVDTGDSARIVARLDETIPRLMRDGDVPGLSIGLVLDGRLVWHRGYGVKNARTGERVDEHTVFEAASLSKPVFAYAVLQLVDAGKLDLDRPLDQYLAGPPPVPNDPRVHQVTARHVLSHTTGFPNWRRGDALTMHFTPGSRFSYSGEGFVYLARVVEQITGEQLDDFVARTVFRPLRMTNSSYQWRPSYDTTSSWYHNTRGEPAMRRGSPGQSNVAASLRTTGEDYGRFLAAILTGKGLKPSTWDAMWTSQSQVLEGGATTLNRPNARPFPGVSWGLGWGLQSTADGRSLFHWGDNGDAKAYVVARERDRTGVVMFMNSTYGTSIVPELVAAALGGEQPGLAWLTVETYRSPARRLFKRALAEGAEPALRAFLELRRTHPDSARLTEDQMNRFGLDLLRMGRVKDAIVLLAQNVSDHPESFNVYDSLGEAYAVAGERVLAIANYERSIAINPRNTDGIEALKRLRARH